MFKPLPLPTDNWPKAIGYARVSQSIQWEKGLSIDTQNDTIKRYAQEHKLHLLETCSEQISGGVKDRPALKRAVSLLKPHYTLIVSDLDRLCRDVDKARELWLHCKKDNMSLRATNSDMDYMTPDGEMIYNMMMSVHQRMRQNVGEKIKENLQRVIKEGKLRRKPPFGYKMISKQKDFEKDEKQFQILQEIMSLFNSGMNTCAISLKLNNEGKNSCLGIYKSGKNKGMEKKFYPTSINRILADYGSVEPTGSLGERKPIKDRIVCHRRDKIE